MASSSAIRDGIITMLNSASVLGANSASTSYGILETTAGCGAVVSVITGEDRVDTFNNSSKRYWTFLIQGYIKDNNNAPLMLDSVHQFVDKVFAMMRDDNTIVGTVSCVDDLRMARSPYDAVEAGGFTWLPIEIEVDAWTFET